MLRERASFTRIVVQVDQQVRLDIRLEVGVVAEAVEVVGGAPLIETENASMGDVIDTRKVSTLPLNGRNFLQPARLSPGVNTGGDGGAGISINGGRGDYNGFLVDGTSNFNRFTGGIVFRPNVDSIQEFKIQTSNYSAESGFAGSGQVNLVTKSGTNRFHGSAYEFLRNAKLDARNYFAPPGPKTPFKRNQFGATAGGPIRKDRTFFFGDYEGLRIRQAASAVGFRACDCIVKIRKGPIIVNKGLLDHLPQPSSVLPFEGMYLALENSGRRIVSGGKAERARRVPPEGGRSSRNKPAAHHQRAGTLVNLHPASSTLFLSPNAERNPAVHSRRRALRLDLRTMDGATRSARLDPDPPAQEGARCTLHPESATRRSEAGAPG